MWEFKQIKDLHLRIVAPCNLFIEFRRGAKRDPTPHWENAEKFIKDLKGARLNGGVQIEQAN